MVIFSYTGSPQVKISQKVLGGYFFDSHCSKGQFIVVKIPKRRALVMIRKVFLNLVASAAWTPAGFFPGVGTLGVGIKVPQWGLGTDSR